MSDGKAQSQEPTMEEILASIRRIISENDEPAAAAQPAAPAPAPKADPKPEPKAEARPEPKPEPKAPAPKVEEDVLELTDMVAETPKAEEPTAVAEPVPPPPQPRPSPPPFAAPQMEGSDLVSAPVAASATAAFGALAQALNRETGSYGNMPLGPGNTLEDLVKDMLRPMLRDWLDQNLAQLVERLVRRELERMVRRAEDL